MKKFLIFIILMAFTAFQSEAQDTTTAQNNYFLEFVKKVYFNPTVFLRTQNFRESTKVRALVLPDLNGSEANTITGFEKAMQKIIRFLIEGDDKGSVRFYFDMRNGTAPFSFVPSDELKCKFRNADVDSITKRLNAPFAGANFNLNSHILFETAIDKALNYISVCLQNNTFECGDQADNQTTEINTKPLSIGLYNTTGSKFDVDVKQFTQLESFYAKAYDVFTQQDWYAPAKVLVSGADADEPMVLALNRHESLFKKENLMIKVLYNNSVLPVLAGSTNDSIRFKIPKDLPVGNPVEVVVTYKSPVDSMTYTVGFFMVQVMEKQTIKVNLVAANGFNLAGSKAQIEAELKKIYDPVGITFEIAEKSLIPESDWKTTIEIGSSGLLSNYPPDLRDWVNGVQDIADYDKDEYYLVYGLSTSEQLGYMPRARNIGFIFSGASNLGETSAHELGHGIFHLRHIFADEELGANGMYGTRNVMDYKDGETIKLRDLYAHQWQFIADPAFVSWFGGDDEEGASLGPIFGLLDSTLRNKDKTICFMTPNKKVVKLPKTTVFAYTSDGNDEIYGAPEMLATGLLMEFGLLLKSSNGDSYFIDYYVATFDTINNQFLGYKWIRYDADIAQRITDEVVEKFYGEMPLEINLQFDHVDNYYFNGYLPMDPKDFGLLAFNDYRGNRCFFKFESTKYTYAEEHAQLIGPAFQIIGNKLEEFKIKGYAIERLNSSPIVVNNYNVDAFYIMNSLNYGENVNDYIWILSKIAEFRAKYPGMYDQMSSTTFNAWTSTNNFLDQLVISVSNAWNTAYTTLATLGEEEALIDTYFKAAVGANKDFFDQYYYTHELHTRPVNEVWLRFLNCFYYLTKNYNKVFKDDLDKIDALSCTQSGLPALNMTADRLLMILEAMEYSKVNQLCSKKRLAMIAVLLNPQSLVNDYGIVWDRYEVGILKLLRNSDIYEKYNLLNDLCTYKIGGKFIIQKMVDGIDDETCWIGSDNFTELLNWVITSYTLHEHDLAFLTSEYANPSAEQIKLLKKRTVVYNYSGFVKRLFNSIIKSQSMIAHGNGDKMTDVKLEGDKVKVKNYFEVCFMDVMNIPYREYNLMDALVIVDDANLVDVYAKDNNSKAFVAPAVVLYFLESKAGAKTTEAIIQTVADVASLAIPGGAAFKILTYADKLSSVASLAGSYVQDDYPELAQTLNLTSSILGLGSMGGDFMFSSFKSADNLDDAVDLLYTRNPAVINSAQNANLETTISSLESRLDNALDPNAASSSVRTADRAMLDKSSSRGMLVDILENEKSSLHAAGRYNQASKYSQLISKVKNYKNVFTDNYFYRQFSKLSDYWDGNKLFKSSGKLSGDKIMDVVNADQIRVYSFTPSGSIGESAELLGSYNGVKYFDGSGSTLKTGDFFIYKENGNIKLFCLNGANCFTENTLVETKKGKIRIKDVKEGDEVMSFNEKTMKKSFKKVVTVFKNQTSKLVRVITNKDTIFSTPEHPFYTSNGWKAAKDLMLGSLLVTSFGTEPVKAIQELDSVATVYNFEVAVNHTYIVGNGQVYVHNTCIVANQLMAAGKLDPKDLTAFVNDFGSNTTLLNKFANGEISVDAWKAFENLPNLRKNASWLTRSTTWLDEGAELVTTNGITKLRKNGVDILEIKNDKILPIQYDYNTATGKPNVGGTPVGDPSNGYQVYKHGNDLSVRRIPDTAPYSQTELTALTAHPEAHVLERHGPDVPDEALTKRSQSGTAPDGSPSVTGNPPAYSSKFDSPEKVKDALNSVQPGSPAFNSRVYDPEYNSWVVEAPGNFGYGFASGGAGGRVQMLKVTAYYQEVSPNNFQLITMFPNR